MVVEQSDFCGGNLRPAILIKRNDDFAGSTCRVCPREDRFESFWELPFSGPQLSVRKGAECTIARREVSQLNSQSDRMLFTAVHHVDVDQRCRSPQKSDHVTGWRPHQRRSRFDPLHSLHIRIFWHGGGKGRS